MDFPKIMGIINATPDSFSDGDGAVNQKKLYLKAARLIADGADIIDIGGESTRPGAEDVPANIELDRILPIVKLIRKNFPHIPVSIDTRKAEVAEAALDVGASYLNDISGLAYQPDIASLAARHNAKLIIMHSKNCPENMQDNPHYNDVLSEVYEFLQRQIAFARQKGVQEIIADTGIGFAKNYEHNITLLKNLSSFNTLGVPQLLGISRKRFIGQITQIENPAERDTATMLLHSLLLQTNAIAIIRVHNVAMATQLKQLYLSLA